MARPPGHPHSCRKTHKSYDIAIVTTDMTATAAEIVARYASRWSIEVCFHDAKNITGVGETQKPGRKGGPTERPFHIHGADHHRPVVHNQRQPRNANRRTPQKRSLVHQQDRPVHHGHALHRPRNTDHAPNYHHNPRSRHTRRKSESPGQPSANGVMNCESRDRTVLGQLLCGACGHEPTARMRDQKYRLTDVTFYQLEEIIARPLTTFENSLDAVRGLIFFHES